MCWYGIKRLKNVQCLIVEGLLDLYACGQSDATSVERRGVFGDLQLLEPKNILFISFWSWFSWMFLFYVFSWLVEKYKNVTSMLIFRL